MLDRFALEIITKTKITQHLKKSMMACRVADIIEIVMLASRPNTPLRGDRPVIRSFIMTEKYIFELHHPCIGK